MLPQASVEERLEAVEEAIVALRKQLAVSQPISWLEEVTGSFKDEPAFDEVLAYARAVREENYTLDDIQAVNEIFIRYRPCEYYPERR